MLEKMFLAILITSCLGGLLAILLLLIKPITKKHFSAAWHYYIWLVALSVMIIPIRMEVPQSKVVSEITNHVQEMMSHTESSYDEQGHRLVSSSLQDKRKREIAFDNAVEMLAPGWFAAAMGLMLLKVLSYHVYLFRLKRKTKEISCQQIQDYTKRKVRVRSGGWIASPMLVGVIKPILLLPDVEMNEEQLRNVLSHEMTHLRRQDMLVKWLLAWAKCLHWYNPLIYIIGRQMEEECEISCDLSVTAKMSSDERKSYMETILAFLAMRQKKEYALSMGMAGSKELLKKRFLQIKTHKFPDRAVRRFSIVLATFMLVGIQLYSGGMLAKALPEIISMSDLSYKWQKCSKCKKDVPSIDEHISLNYVKDVEHEIYGSVGQYKHVRTLKFSCPYCGQEWWDKIETDVVSEYVLEEIDGINYMYRVDSYGESK